MQDRVLDQRGFTLFEALIAGALVAVALGALLAASSTSARFATHQTPPARDAALLVADRIATDLRASWKYASVASPPPVPTASWTESVPLAVPNAAPTTIPLQIDVRTALLSAPSASDPTSASASATITVGYPASSGGNPAGSVQEDLPLRVQAPFPGTVIDSGKTVTPPPNAP